MGAGQAPRSCALLASVLVEAAAQSAHLLEAPANLVSVVAGNLGLDRPLDLSNRHLVSLALDQAVNHEGDILSGEGRAASGVQGVDNVHRAVADFDVHLSAELDRGGDGVEDAHFGGPFGVLFASNV